jgi:hypothetical protein
MSFHNNCASLDFHKQSLKGKVQDFIISFNEEQTDIQHVLKLTWDLFQQLVNSFPEKDVIARLVAKVNFIHVNNLKDEMEERSYHFPSYRSEKVFDAEKIFKEHMTKIASRLDSFNTNGSNLLLKNIAHIHILITLV